MNNKRSRNQATAPPQAASAPGLPALSGADGPGRPAVAGAQVLVQQTAYSGQVPPPEILEGFDRLVPGTAARIIAWAEEEQSHRHRLEHDAQAANIESQRRVGCSLGRVRRAVQLNQAIELSVQGYQNSFPY